MVLASTIIACSDTANPQAAAAADREALAAARAAVDAWGRFTASGRLSRIAPYFHKGGPQYRRLKEDAAGVAADPAAPTRVILASGEVVRGTRGDEQRVVRGTVVVSRPMRPDRGFRCEIVLFRAPDSRWRVWTMREIGRRDGPLSAWLRVASPP